MLSGLFKNSGSLTHILISFFVMVASVTIFMSIGYAIAPVFFDISLNKLNEITSGQTQNITILKYFQVIQSVSLFIIPPFVIAWLLGEKSKRYLSMTRGIRSGHLLIIPLLMLGIIPFINFLAELNSRLDLPSFMTGVEDWMKEMEESGQEISRKFMIAESPGGLVFNLIMIAILPAVGEELLFRGVFQQQFARLTRSMHWGVIIAAFLFSLMHLQFYGLIPRLVLGILMGYLFLWSGSIWLPVIAHFFNNAIIVVFYYLYQNNGFSYNLEEVGKDQRHLMPVFTSLLISVFFLWLLYQHRKKN
ncbi:MAG: CPBP family intramembrane glutamic endopeptidase [Bacteroidales bacterium]